MSTVAADDERGFGVAIVDKNAPIEEQEDAIRRAFQAAGANVAPKAVAPHRITRARCRFIIFLLKPFVRRVKRRMLIRIVKFWLAAAGIEVEGSPDKSPAE